MAVPHVGELRPRVWAAVRALAKAGSVITVPAIVGEMHGFHDTCGIRRYLRALTAAGILATQETPGRGGAWSLVHDCGAMAPRVRADGSAVLLGSGRASMWWLMRVMHGPFTARELAIHASSTVHHVPDREAENYAGNLTRAGFLHRLKPGQWRLVQSRWNGPLPPQIQAGKRVFDPNTGTTYSTVDGQAIPTAAARPAARRTRAPRRPAADPSTTESSPQESR
ncbi:hypothetical protein [uncultured Lamprocystis sp.]|uniref:hypothetical protein n=1 Tax=uncultured Lamprocystis sp. TaxID=543132 RepID=UPI0025CEB449|nr:hypothetical protein [uncultured Lamprocystis sp.]